MNIGIVGLGLIGGSAAKAIKTKTGHSVFAIDISKETMLMAKLSGAVDESLGNTNIGDCDIIILALRPGIAIKWLEDNGERLSERTTVVDFCGVKRNVTRKMRAIADTYSFNYLGAHPMAGKERGGFKNSTPDLFVGASMILTPDDKTSNEMINSLSSLCYDIGFSRIVLSNPEEHDKIIAYTSQLAHIVSSAYIKSPEAEKQRGFSAGSYKDMTRVAFLDENMWTELFMENADYLTDELDTLITHLEEYRDVLKSGDKKTLHDLLRDGRECKIRAGGN